MTACFYSHASIIAFDDSSDSVYDGGFGYQNGGTGFAGWLWGGDWYHGLFEPYIDHGGKFIDQDTRGDRGFRIFSHDGYKVHSSRTFSSSLNQDDMFSMNLGHIGGNDGTLHFAILANSNPILELELIAGSSSWRAWDGEYFDLNDENGFANYSTTDNEDAEFTFTYHGGSSYGFSLTDGAGNGYHLASKNASSAPNSMNSINRFSFKSEDQGINNEFYIDNLQIEVIPEPASFGLFGLFAIITIFVRRKFAF
tara:strand:+ start:1368 stop:2126 length:759 start_codon:yes stop_codon:yes gene_type:complete